MPFLAGLKSKARTAYEEKKASAKTSYEKWQQAKPEAPQPITRSTTRQKGMITGGLFTGNGAGLTGTVPLKKKRKSKKAITVKIDGQKIKIVTAKKAKKKKRTTQNLDITNIHGSLF